MPKVKSEDASRFQPEWCRVNLAHAGDAVITTDIGGRVTSLNPVAESLTGWSQNEAAGTLLASVFKVVNPDTRKTVESPTVRALRDGVNVELANHTLLIAKDGTEWPIDDSAAPIRNPEGEVAGVMLVFRDVTERRRQEQQVQDALAYADDIIATLREPFVVLDHELRIRTANLAFYKLFHVTKEETENRQLYELGNGEWDIVRLRTLLNEVLSLNHSVQDFEVEHVFPNLGRKTMLLNARRFTSNTKNLELILLAIEDITERSRLEKLMQEQSASLEDLHHRKDEFLAMLSHELRNPLAPIANAVQLLRLQKNENQLQHQARTIIERQVGQLTRLIDDLLEVSRITTGRIHLQQKLVALNGIVENAVESVRPLLDQRQHELLVSLSVEPIWLFADATRMEQVVVNLLTNAAKYTDKGGNIWLTTQQEGDECVLRVRDTGVGIAPELLPNIFDLFTQADQSLDRSQGGLGIGLALVQRLVEMHVGRVEVHSTLGQGSEFVVLLPVVETPALQPPSTHTEIDEPICSFFRVMVVDDNVDTAQSLKTLLKELGHDVLTAHDGPSTLEAALDYCPNVMLLDIGLPGMDGYEVAKKIRQWPCFKNVVLVAITGYGQESDRQRSQEAGFDHHLVKPLDFTKLLQILVTASEMTK